MISLSSDSPGDLKGLFFNDDFIKSA